MQRALLRMAQWWTGAPPPPGGLRSWRSGFKLGPLGQSPSWPSTPGSGQAAAWRYLPSVTLRQHLLFFLFPLDLVGSGKGFSVLALRADSAPKSCSQQHDRPSWVELKAVPLLVFLAKRIGAKVAKQSGRFATHVTMMPRAFPLSCNETQQISRSDGTLTTSNIFMVGNQF